MIMLIKLQYQHAMQCYLNAEQFLKESSSFDLKDITPP